MLREGQQCTQTHTANKWQSRKFEHPFIANAHDFSTLSHFVIATLKSKFLFGILFGGAFFFSLFYWNKCGRRYSWVQYVLMVQSEFDGNQNNILHESK